jgi:CRISPR/Cas system-associated protein Csm6
MEGGMVFRQPRFDAPRSISGGRIVKIKATPIYKPISTHLSIFAAFAGQTPAPRRSPVFPSN